MTGVLPTKTSVRITESDGSIGTIPAATESAAGCMSAAQVQKLEKLWLVHETRAGETVILERAAPDTSHLVTRDQLRQIMTALPKPDPRALFAPVLAEVEHRLSALPAPSTSDDGLREIVHQVIDQTQALDMRLREVEVVIETLRRIAAVKAAMTEAS